MSSNIPLVSGELTIGLEPSHADGSVVLAWRGRSVHRQPARTILPCVMPWLDRAQKLAVPLEMRFEVLEHMNSSTVTTIVQIIQEARTRGTQLVLVYDASKPWQRLGFEALRVFVKDDGLLELTNVRRP